MAASDGGGAHRWGLCSSAHRQPQAQRTVAKPWRQQRAQAVRACKTLCRPACACEAEAQQALTRVEAGWQPTFLHDSTVGPTPHDGKRGRPGPGAQPAQIVSSLAGALASRRTDRRTRIDPQRCCILATHALDEGQFSSQAGRDGEKGQARAERGWRFLKAPQCFASSLSRKKPERVRALVMGMTVCVLGDAALESRMRNALQANAATVPDPKGQRIQHPTARWGFPDFVGMHVLRIPGPPYIVFNLTEEHLHVLQLLGKRYVWFYR